MGKEGRSVGGQANVRNIASGDLLRDAVAVKRHQGIRLIGREPNEFQLGVMRNLVAVHKATIGIDANQSYSHIRAGTGSLDGC